MNNQFTLLRALLKVEECNLVPQEITIQDLMKKLSKVEQAFISLEKNIHYDDYLNDLASHLEYSIAELGLAIEDYLLED